MVRKPLICFLIVINAVSGSYDWHGGWFPYTPEAGVDNNPVATIRQNMYDPEHGVVMGVKNRQCDDAKTNLQIDWDFNPVNHTCFVLNRRQFFAPRSDIHPLHSQDYIPKAYSAPHKCMSEPINYNVIVPTFGTHRPLWAKYGEYVFLPRQRWVHNLEHGAVVMLYHPCADQNEVNFLRKLVKNCLYRHVITPYNLLSAERPLALVTWGHRLEMSKVAPEIVVDFIRKHALKGPEQTARDGQYDLMLKDHSGIVSDLKDRELCKEIVE
ncbi:uncharacterized protein LOC658689 [Tribolium castaneum]|uniref:DUF3105 domain-containing protein n=1 Tax=Tribolium castaneum TaxID=7070 RepID=D6X0F7_TRICA|nr:PREDICTED: uncharacterized protein LOC658689 [Tribolium castaneum]EFA09580.1 hypothetical protein TcasGA2_TC011695 [Tribolium castaneum]|eukprot:XP_970146.1 PREDICTED: uncharacterized protein LOC658689 [Tribolium castaneum]